MNSEKCSDCDNRNVCALIRIRPDCRTHVTSAQVLCIFYKLMMNKMFAPQWKINNIMCKSANISAFTLCLAMHLTSPRKKKITISSTMELRTPTFSRFFVMFQKCECQCILCNVNTYVCRKIAARKM